MRVLFAFAGGSGHAEPLVPLAEAAGAAGHAVAFCGRRSALDPLESRGFRVYGTEDESLRAERRLPLEPLDLERERRQFRSGFAERIATGKAATVIELHAVWRPDVVVCDDTDFGSMVAAERLGLPHVTVLVLAARSFATRELVAQPLDALRAQHGLAPDPRLEMLARDLVLAPFPPSYRDPAAPLPPNTQAYRPQSARIDERAEPPLVYFTLGTVFTFECGDLYERVLAALAALPVEAVATVGRRLDPDELGPQPPHVRVERYVPQAELLPRASVVVSHGGSGSVLGALAHGVPMVLLPLGADQPFNAERCAQLGVARVLDPVTAGPDEIGAAISAVLAEPAYAVAAARLRDEFAALPGPDHAVALVKALVRSS